MAWKMIMSRRIAGFVMNFHWLSIVGTVTDSDFCTGVS